MLFINFIINFKKDNPRKNIYNSILFFKSTFHLISANLSKFLYHPNFKIDVFASSLDYFKKIFKSLVLHLANV